MSTVVRDVRRRQRAPGGLLVHALTQPAPGPLPHAHLMRRSPTAEEIALALKDPARLAQLSALGERTPVGAKHIGSKVLVHLGALVIAIACFAAYGHLKLEGRSTAATVSLVSAAVFGFIPLRDVLRIFFRVEGKALHFAHGIG